ncbi:MAG TPA: AbrB/MazE/SpoVT family DNA-binding domain-containing protein [Nitrososphaeraceae archaeon]|nr:AbrB/MazE/SpoVT family DNA-binding domain-containing protein [Nitrososphaeraceae archaeon]
MSINDTTKKEKRKIQALTGERSLTVVLPKEFAQRLGIRKGDYVDVTQYESKIVIEKA